ncbi:hypothetical protein WJX72_007555 [[Myrmecia] bisecta]|uniref:Flagellar associated protein n=1 Tax=[Myrmecia] bisecta TaxID=41462 RepID=A0AAW1P370_9CHLO
MKTNVLVQKVELGKVKRTTFQHPAEDKIFGITRAVDAEGAREVSMIWREHQPNPDDKPGPDFRAMNKLAATSGLTDSHDQRTFREHHSVTLKTGHAVSHPAPLLPSDRNRDFVYGRPSTYKTMEEIRVVGRENPNMKQLMQGAYTWEWMKMNQDRAERSGAGLVHRDPARPTKASLGHSSHAAVMARAPSADKSTFKLSKFKQAKSKIDNKRV